MRLFHWLSIVGVMLMLAWAGLDIWLWQLAMRRVPAKLDAVEVTYRNEWVGGIGPGANEAGVVVYSFPTDVADQIASEGLPFFDTAGTGWSSWRQTPIDRSDGQWPRPDSLADIPDDAPPLDVFMNGWGFVIAVDPRVARAINDAMALPGSFYTYTRAGGMVIVAPAARSAYLIYAG